MFPLFLFPPSEIKGISYSLQIGATSINAVNYGTPQPLTNLVVHIDPFPIPHLIPSAPDLINLYAPSPVAIDPATTSHDVPSVTYLSLSSPYIQTSECPFAISKTSTLQPAFINFTARSMSSSLAPTAAPTYN